MISMCNSIESNFGQAAILIGSQRDFFSAVAHCLSEPSFKGATVKENPLTVEEVVWPIGGQMRRVAVKDGYANGWCVHGPSLDTSCDTCPNEASTHYREIALTRGKIALVDQEDYERVSAFHWQAAQRNHTWYAMRNVRDSDGHTHAVFLHRVILQAQSGQHVDHRNRNGLDCRRANLRLATPRLNSYNSKRKKNESGYKGVYRSKKGSTLWRAVIKQYGKSIYLGNYSDPKEAARAYDAKARELFGEFAWLNFPEGDENGAE